MIKKLEKNTNFIAFFSHLIDKSSRASDSLQKPSSECKIKLEQK